jgi:septum formation protein
MPDTLPPEEMHVNGSPTKPHSETLILASASPRRRELLARLELPFVVIPSSLEEPPLVDARSEPPEETAQALAYYKAASVADLHPGRWTLGADTLVACGGELLGKPRDVHDAQRMLVLQAQQPADVITGLALVKRGTDPKRLLSAKSTRVWMRDDPQARAAYLDSGDWHDKAGAYGIQTVGDSLIERIAGSFSNVVGLPLKCVLIMLSQSGIACQVNLDAFTDDEL